MRRHAAPFLLTLLASCVAIALVACSAAPAAPIALTAADDGSTQSLAVGQELRVTLDSNPTTGYRWAVDGAVPAHVRQVGAPEYNVGSSALGAGGTEVWTFAGTSAGDATLKLKYWRSFEPTATPERTFEVRVRVK